MLIFRALEIMDAGENHELGMYLLATLHFYVNMAEWIGEADSIKPLDRDRKALK